MLQRVFFPKDNCIEVAQLLFTALQVKVSSSTVQKELTEHPDYPSLLAITDVLSNYGVASVAFKTTITRLPEIEGPFIAVIRSQDNGDQFTLVQSATAGITYYNTSRHKWLHVDHETFNRMWPTGIVLLADAENAHAEKDYAQKVKAEKRSALATYTKFLALPIMVLAASLVSLIQSGSTAVLPVLFALTTLAGCITTALIIWYELGAYNPVLQQICGGGKKRNCGAVLHSRASKIGNISWSVIGFCYFTGGLLLLLFNRLVSVQTLSLLSWINVLALPYVFFSVYYQWRIARQWCMFCLTVQLLLVIQFAVSLLGGWHAPALLNNFSMSAVWMPLALAYVIPFIALGLLQPAWQAAKAYKNTKAALQRLKHNPHLFEALLQKQNVVTEDPTGLGLVLGNPRGKYKIIKVCNPYCGPCAKAHAPLEQLLEANPEVQLQIIFTATTHEADLKAYPVKHLLAIAQYHNNAMVNKALNDWYLPEKRDYTTFAAKYPMNGELQQQTEKVNAMNEWCEKMNIHFTPTFFINGHQLPDIYNANDLKYFLTE